MASEVAGILGLQLVEGAGNRDDEQQAFGFFTKECDFDDMDSCINVAALTENGVAKRAR